MKTYQDLLALGDSRSFKDITQFINGVIVEYKSSPFYKEAVIADAYNRQDNVTIREYKKLLYTVTGKAVVDNYSANYKCASNYFNRFVTQENQYLLGNGVVFNDETTKEKLGGDDFDIKLQSSGMNALVHGVSYNFFNYDHVEVFSALEFAPLWDEEDGGLKAGVRFWQVADNKPLRVTLFELDGYTDFKRKKGEWSIVADKRAYKIDVLHDVDGDIIYNYENYPSFPVVPLWGNTKHLSELHGRRDEIDAYDLIRSGFANDLDDASMIYWTIKNAGGMDDVDLAQFVQRMKTVKAYAFDDDEQAEAHTTEVPYQSRVAYLDRLENDLYNDFMALNMSQISSNVTATAIKASYGPLDNKTDSFEYCVSTFIKQLLHLINVEDTPKFTRSRIINQQEETQMVLSCAQYLDTKTILTHLPFLSNDEIEPILDALTRDESDRFVTPEEPEEQEEQKEPETNELKETVKE